MKLLKKVEKAAKKMRWYDVSLLKLCVFFATLFLVTAWPGFRNVVFGIPWYAYLILAVICAIPLVKKIYS